MRHSIRRRGNAFVHDRGQESSVAGSPNDVTSARSLPPECTELTGAAQPEQAADQGKLSQECLDVAGKGNTCRQQRPPAKRRCKTRLSAMKGVPQVSTTTGIQTLIQRLESIQRGIRPLELAAILGLGKTTLYDWIAAGTIPAYRHRGVVFFDPALIAIWLRRQATQGPPA